MATPQWVRFSHTQRTMEQLCKEDLANLFTDFSCRLWVITELGIIRDTGAFGNIDAPFIECDDIERALQLSRSWAGVAMTFVVEDIWHNITLNLWEENNECNICLFLAKEIIWYESDDYDQGEWLLKFLLQFSAAIDALCCGYGRDNEYEFKYEALDPDMVLARVRNGLLFQIHDPVIHLLSEKLISAREIRDLVNKYGAREGFKYLESTTGYHVFWNV